jgi:hypothetical protein
MRVASCIVSEIHFLIFIMFQTQYFYLSLFGHVFYLAFIVVPIGRPQEGLMLKNRRFFEMVEHSYILQCISSGKHILGITQDICLGRLLSLRSWR